MQQLAVRTVRTRVAGNAEVERPGGVTQKSNALAVSDICSGRATFISAETCGGSYPQKPAKKKDPALPPTINRPEL
jgi:hypothetical protein